MGGKDVRDEGNCQIVGDGQKQDKHKNMSRGWVETTVGSEAMSGGNSKGNASEALVEVGLHVHFRR